MIKPGILLLAILLLGCGEAATTKHEPLAPSDPYIQTLRAMMNLGGCRHQRRSNPSAAEIERTEELIADAQSYLESVEELARSKGLGDYLERGRVSFARQVAEELNATCDPNEDAASKQAGEAIERFREHVMNLPAGLADGAVVRAPASIRYDAGVCYGTCPVFTVTLSDDGSGSFIGREHTAVLGERRFLVSKATFSSFARALAPLKPPRGSVPKGRPCNMNDGASYTVTWVGRRGEQQSLCWGDHRQLDDLITVRSRMNEAIQLLPITGYVGENMPPTD